MGQPSDDIIRLWENGKRAREERIEARRTLPQVRLWDGDWNFVGSVNDAMEGKFQWKLNDTGSGFLKLRIDDRIAQWAIQHRNRGKKNIHVTMDKDGARWSGRACQVLLKKDTNGERFVELHFLHDYEEVKHVYVWPNPYLPSAVQFPRSFTLVGPTRWVLKVALMLNIRRLAGKAFSFPEDPLDSKSWFGVSGTEFWGVQVAPNSPLSSDASPWTVISSRMKSWHEMAKQKLADAQLSVECRRWLTGDPEPWPGARIRHGCLVIDIVDKSGYWSEDGTVLSGSRENGFVRTLQTVFGGGDLDTRNTVLPAPRDVPQYRQRNWLGTAPNYPYVVYNDGPITGVESSEYSWEPATSTQVVTGGHSAYGVNEAISATVKLVGNYIGNFILLPTLGAIADTFLQPIYADTLFAWMTSYSSNRSRELGWSHYYEHFVDGADKAYTISAVLALRRGMWETREKISHKINVADGAPWFIGDRGQGHYFLGDRIGATIQGLGEDIVVVEQVTELVYEFNRTKRGWSCVCGDLSSQHSPLEQVLSQVKEVQSAAHDLGVI